MPRLPEFKPIEISDRDNIQKSLWEYQPETSELTFTNLFIWKEHYGVMWTRYEEWLLFLFTKTHCGLPPIGPSPREEVTRLFLGYLKEKYGNEASLERVDKRLVGELSGVTGLTVTPTPGHFDYVYRREDLVQLAGRKYHTKRNHLNTFLKNNSFTYKNLTYDKIAGCMEMAERWCNRRRCKDDLGLREEFQSTIIALQNFAALKIKGGIIEIAGNTEAFTLGELLNAQTAVIHVEKADPDIRGLYTAINQQFCENVWSSVPFINREQDLGEPQLRRAKLSYNPDHMVEKFRMQLNEYYL